MQPIFLYGNCLVRHHISDGRCDEGKLAAHARFSRRYDYWPSECPGFPCSFSEDAIAGYKDDGSKRIDSVLVRCLDKRKIRSVVSVHENLPGALPLCSADEAIVAMAGTDDNEVLFAQIEIAGYAQLGVANILAREGVFPQ